MICASKVTSKGQITLPCGIRNRMRIDAGDTLLFEIVDDAVVMRKPKDLMDYVGFLGAVDFPDDEEALLTPERGRAILERD